jgi:hypothetical protein
VESCVNGLRVATSVHFCEQSGRSVRGNILFSRWPVYRRKLVNNRFWVFTNKCLFLRARGLAIRGVLDTDWVYRRAFPPSGLRRQKVAALITDLGRFGNAVSRMANGFATTIENGWGVALLPRSAHSRSQRVLFPASAFTVANRVTVSFGDEAWRGREAPNLIVRREFRRGSPPGDSEAHKLCIEMLRLCFPGVQPSGSSGPRSLTIHIRSGDIFYRERVGNWGQPPASYYTKIIESQTWSDVVVISQDDASPVLAPIRSFCELLSIPCVFQASSFSSDLAVLVDAVTLVAGRGSFIPAVTIFSRRLETVFYFEDRFVLPLKDQRFRIRRIVDLKGDYKASILGGRWKNTPIQRELMVSYPQRWLGYES